MKSTKLENICKKYCSIEHNEDNYSIGGGLSSGAFASRRHENAKYDEGKLTEGKATQLFMKATGLSLEVVKEVINYAVPNMEWHHAGKLPKSYGGGMKKTYFLNSKELCDIATNWDSYIDKLSISKVAAKIQAEEKKSLEEIKLLYLQTNAKKLIRVEKEPVYFYETAREMNGKYGWFDCTHKSYSMTKYYTGWEFETEEKLNEFYQIK